MMQFAELPRLWRIVLNRLVNVGRADIVRLRHAKWMAVRSTEGKPCDDGLTLALDLAELKSLSQLGRDFILKLANTSVRFGVLDIGVDRSLPKIASNELDRFTRFVESKVTNRRVLIFAAGEIEKDANNYNILTPFWEFQSGLPEVSPAIFANVDHIVVFSRFCETYFKRISPPGIGVDYIRYPLPDDWCVRMAREDVRVKYGIPQNAFTVFFHFDFRSGYDRKNPEGALRAFVKAFAHDQGAKIVIKAAGADWDIRNSMRFRSLIKELRIEKNIVTVYDFLSHQEILDLIGASDVYISLHRGEGLGIGMLEAMSVGTPVVATAYGGNMDFTNDDTAMLVGYDMVKPKTSFALYRGVVEWPEPDEAEAAAALKTLRNRPEFAKKKAANAKRFIDNYFSITNFTNDIIALLTATEVPSRQEGRLLIS